jgi:hypothetical protein
MNIPLKHHVGLTTESWFKKSLFVQLANVGADIDRTIHWRDKDTNYSKAAFERVLELLTLTILDPKHKRSTRRELVRTRECLIDYFVYDNVYKTSDKIWHDYFFQFSYAAALERERRYTKQL